ncbi:hypothetical protein OJAV_G00218560 [Oryzias javanicus]|uniref:Uncharacterized protein n=1 Tax=Oryzias javanicus TaxID=123683 RepID=A0A3S2MF37_ORYJA|nr:hypothetical protein OJAV_G00218560 [Oryzias javanicus]
MLTKTSEPLFASVVDPWQNRCTRTQNVPVPKTHSVLGVGTVLGAGSTSFLLLFVGEIEPSSSEPQSFNACDVGI